MAIFRVILGLYWENGKYNANCYNGLYGVQKDLQMASNNLNQGFGIAWVEGWMLVSGSMA